MLILIVSSPICCVKENPTYKNAMNWRPLAIGLVASIALDLTGCGFGRAISAPVRYVFSSPEPTPAPNASDVSNPGRPVPVSSPTPRETVRTSAQRPASTTSNTATKSPTKKSSETTAASQFPTAKPAPGKPGLVLNPFKANSYIDVSGYAPGSKVKDPESQRIFIVP